MNTIFFSAKAEKAIATYLDQHTEMALSGRTSDSYWCDLHNRMAHMALKQIMLDNDEITGYSATLAEIKAEKAA